MGAGDIRAPLGISRGPAGGPGGREAAGPSSTAVEWAAPHGRVVCPHAADAAVVHSDSGATLLDRLHEHLIEQAGGVSSIVVHVDRTSAAFAREFTRVEYLPLEPWPAGPGELRTIDQALSLVKVIPVEFAAGSRTGQLLGAPADSSSRSAASSRRVQLWLA